MTIKPTKLICTSCGQIAAGDQAPNKCPTCGAPSGKFHGEGDALTLEEVRGRARDKLKNICAVYPQCDGDKDKICQRENYGRAIGMGGAGMGGSFRQNVQALDRLKLYTRVVGDAIDPDLSFDFFGTKLSMPVMGASTSGMSQYNGAISEIDFCRATLQGCLDIQTISWRGDTFFYTKENHYALASLAEFEGRGVPIFKPRSQNDLLELIARAQDLGCIAVGVDLDGHGSTNFARAGQPVYRKSPKEIEQLVRASKIPFIAKGIMHAEDARLCVEAGAAAVVVSNHGGRVLDSTPGTAEVLPSVVETVGKKAMVLADGGIRNGYDVLKMLALGAKAVLIGRDLIRAAIGAGSIGVQLQMRHYKTVLRQAMVMTGCKDLASIQRSVLTS